jgi:hypothetical protein
MRQGLGKAGGGGVGGGRGGLVGAHAGWPHTPGLPRSHPRRRAGPADHLPHLLRSGIDEAVAKQAAEKLRVSINKALGERPLPCALGAGTWVLQLGALNVCCRRGTTWGRASAQAAQPTAAPRATP